MRKRAGLAFGALIAGLSLTAGFGQAGAAAAPAPDQPPPMLSKQNLAKPRPAAPFNLTGTWFIDIRRSEGGFTFVPTNLTPAAQALYDEGVKANARGESFRDDTGACWPTGMPRIMTRVWPIQMIQLPTGIIMISGFMDEVRWIYMDGRSHPDPDVMVPSWNGHSIGRWEGDTLVVDTVGYEGRRHWMHQGVPISEQAHSIERIRLIDNGAALETEYTWTDPVNWVGEWKTKKYHRPSEDQDVAENHCLPDTNDHIAGAPKFGGEADK
jgi:hypothetical protein